MCASLKLVRRGEGGEGEGGTNRTTRAQTPASLLLGSDSSHHVRVRMCLCGEVNWCDAFTGSKRRSGYPLFLACVGVGRRGGGGGRRGGAKRTSSSLIVLHCLALMADSSIVTRFSCVLHLSLSPGTLRPALRLLWSRRLARVRLLPTVRSFLSRDAFPQSISQQRSPAIGHPQHSRELNEAAGGSATRKAPSKAPTHVSCTPKRRTAAASARARERQRQSATSASPLAKSCTASQFFVRTHGPPRFLF